MSMRHAAITYKEIQAAAVARKVSQIFRFPVVLFFQVTNFDMKKRAIMRQYLQKELPENSQFLIRWLRRYQLDIFRKQIEKRQTLLELGKLVIPDEVLKGHLRGKVNSLLDLPPNMRKNSKLLDRLLEGPNISIGVRINNIQHQQKQQDDEAEDLVMHEYGQAEIDEELTAMYFQEFEDPQKKIESMAYGLKIIMDTEMTFKKGGIMDPRVVYLICMGALIDQHLFTRTQLRQLITLFKTVKQKPGLRLENNPFFDLVGQLRQCQQEMVGIIDAPSKQLVSRVSRPSELLNALLQYHQFQMQQEQQQQQTQG